MESNEKTEILEWYALSAPHRKEMEAQRLLQRNDIECFIPMCTSIVTIGRRKERKCIPAVSNLVFARSTRERLQEVKTGIPYLQYKVNTEEGRNVPIIVPDRDMDRFIRVCRLRNEKVVFVSPDEINIAKGTPVKIIGGELNGLEATFVKVKGKRSKRVVIILKGVTALTTEVEPQYLELIDEKEQRRKAAEQASKPKAGKAVQNRLRK